MYKLTNKSKKIRITFIATTLITCMLMVISFSWLGGIVFHSFTNNYYTVLINGKVAGTTTNYQNAEKIVKNARKQINNENTSLTYVDLDVEIKKSNRVFGKTSSSKKLSKAVYDVMSSEVDETKKKAYVVDIEGYVLTLASLSDVEYLFNEVKNKYDNSGDFSTNLHLDEVSGHSAITCSILKADVLALDIPKVGINGDVTEESEKSEDILEKADGTTDVKFDEKVEIILCYVDESQISELNSAIDMVNSNEKSAELSVVVTEKKTYDEEYGKPTEYVYNDRIYNTQQNILQEASSGVKEVVANVTYKNGEEVSRDILKETIKKEAIAKIVEVGTAVPPTYIKPINGGTLSSTFGMRWGSMHKGIDWACSIGTNVMASCDGTVIQAGWVNGYGNCITLQHSDGKCTRYGHLSEILVSYGQSVSQSEVIALSGNTGNSTGPHVHFEIIEGGVQVNPFTYLD